MFQTNIEENIKTHFMINNLFPENRTAYEIIPKNMAETEEPHTTSQYGTYALYDVLARLHGLMRMHTPHARYPHVRTHTRTNKKYLLLFTASMLRYNLPCLSCYL